MGSAIGAAQAIGCATTLLCERRLLLIAGLPRRSFGPYINRYQYHNNVIRNQHDSNRMIEALFPPLLAP
jgi:hypothetical protein